MSLADVAHVREGSGAATQNEGEATPPSPPSSPVPRRAHFACRRCRMRIFSEKDVVPHESGDSAKKDFKYRRGGPQAREGEATDDAVACTSYFIDPDACPWVAEEIREANAAGAAVDPDTIYCPNARCRAKLGTQSWTGSRCSCGAWVAPAFRIHARAVDKAMESDASS